MAGERIVLTVEEAAKAIGLSRGSAYAAVRRGELPTIRIGRRILVSRDGLERLLASAGKGQSDEDAAAGGLQFVVKEAGNPGGGAGARGRS